MTFKKKQDSHLTPRQGTFLACLNLARLIPQSLAPGAFEMFTVLSLLIWRN